MRKLVGRDRIGREWFSVWRVTCNLCGAYVEGIDAEIDALDAGWKRTGPLDECDACHSKAYDDA